MKNNNKTLRWLYRVTGKNKTYIFILLIVQAVHGGLGVLYALLLRGIVDSAASKNLGGFWWYVSFAVLLVMSQLILRAAMRFLREFSHASIENVLKGRLFGQLQRKDYASVSAVHSGEWLNRLTSDTVVVANGFVDILPGIVGMLVKLFGAFIMIVVLDAWFAAVLVPGGLLLLGASYVFRKRMKTLHKNIQEKDGLLRIFLQERIGSMMMVRSFSVERETELQAEEKMDDHKSARMKRNHFSNICNIAFGMVIHGFYLFGVCYCGYGILAGTITYGTLTAITHLIGQIQSPFANISGYLPRFYAMTASAERLMEIEQFENDSDEPALDIADVRDYYEKDLRALGLKNACFAYYPVVESTRNLTKDNMPVVLDNIDFEIRKGEYVAFTGYSGCGKSTVLKLLMCIYNLDRGERYLLGTDGKIRLSAKWRRLFAYVPQGNQLMSGTIREMVALADTGRRNDDRKIARALEIACADEFVDDLEQGVDTLLGERGASLSEGEMQRLAIARAVFADCPVLLLDEATSALDDKTEKRVLNNLRSMTDKTVIIVTHRPAALEICDKVFRFTENGIEQIGHEKRS